MLGQVFQDRASFQRISQLDPLVVTHHTLESTDQLLFRNLLFVFKPFVFLHRNLLFPEEESSIPPENRAKRL
jgi:hypothetical protein